MSRLEALYEPSGDDVRELLRVAGLGELRHVALLGGGAVNSNYRATTDGGDVLLRIYPESRQLSEVTFELSVLSHLNDAGLPVQRVLSGAAPGAPLTMGGRYAVLLTLLPGRSLRQEELDAGIAHQMGALYATMQDALAGFVPAGAKPHADHAAVEPLVREAVVAVATSCSDEAALLEESWEAVGENFRERSQSTVVHGDLYFENVLVDDRAELRITGLIDFDDSYLGDPLLDLALVASEFAVTTDNVLQPNLLRTFLDSYLNSAAQPVAYTAEEFYSALIFVYIKFACYTFPMQGGITSYSGGNEYLARLHDAMDPYTRERIISWLRGRTTAVRHVR